MCITLATYIHIKEILTQTYGLVISHSKVLIKVQSIPFLEEIYDTSSEFEPRIPGNDAAKMYRCVLKIVY